MVQAPRVRSADTGCWYVRDDKWEEIRFPQPRKKGGGEDDMSKKTENRPDKDDDPADRPLDDAELEGVVGGTGPGCDLGLYSQQFVQDVLQSNT